MRIALVCTCICLCPEDWAQLSPLMLLLLKLC